MTELSTALARPKSANKDYIYLRPSEIAIEDGYNVRFELNEIEELMNSILTEGLQEALHVREENGIYVVEAGHRRVAAARLAIERQIESPNFAWWPCRLAKKFSSEADRLLLQLVRNKQNPLTIWEQVVAIQRLLAMHISEEEIQKRWGVSKQHIRNLLAFSKAPEELVSLVTSKRMSPSTAIDALQRFGSERLLAALDTALANAEAEKEQMILPRHFPGECLRGTKRNTDTNERIKAIYQDCKSQMKACANRKEKQFVRSISSYVRGDLSLEQFLIFWRNNVPASAPRRR